MKKRPTQEDQPKGLTHNPFAALRASDAPRPAPAGPPESTRADAAPVRPDADARGSDATRIVVQREKKGRAGKTVTRVAGLALDTDGVKALTQELKRALGCGASVDGADILLQGALTERAAKWLRERFTADVIVGN